MNAVQAAAVNTFRYGQGTYSAGGDAIDWSYYDTAVIPAALGATRFFTIPVGQAGKTLADTNMISAAQIPSAQNFEIGCLKVFYVSHAMHDTNDLQPYYTLLKNTTVEFNIANKYVYGQWTLAELIGAASLFALEPTAAGDNISQIQPRFHGIIPFNTHIILSQSTVFNLTVTYWAVPGAYLVGDWLMLVLYGKLNYAT
jgi:hypothetical protein